MKTKRETEERRISELRRKISELLSESSEKNHAPSEISHLAAARALRMRPDDIVQLVQSGRLSGYQSGRGWRVSFADVVRMRDGV